MSDVPPFLSKMGTIAAGVTAAIADEMGAMCHRSLFFERQQGGVVSQAEVDAASAAFMATTERLMPAALVHEFVLHAIACRVPVRVEQADLVPGFSDDEAMAGGDAAVRATNPAKKFTRAEVLDCLRYNQREPRIAVALAHFITLLQIYHEGLCALVAARSPEAAEKLEPFAEQWSPKNVLKFLNVALFVAARARTGAAPEPAGVEQSLIEEAMDLLNRSGAFTWSAASPPLRIHCPAQAFLHKITANQGTLKAVIDHVVAESPRTPPDPDLEASLALVRQVAKAEEQGIERFGQEWSRMKLRR